MNVSIAIPTHNRAVEVEKTLVGLSRLDTTGCPDHEVLVIDNNSTDGTVDVVNRLAPLFDGRLRCVREQQQGLNHARNRAIQEARYEIVAYLDDDVDVNAKWLWHLSDAYASGDVAGVGGRAYLVYPGPKPAWLGESIDGLLTKVELGPRRRPAGVDELYGVNMSFRRDWLRRAGGFRPDLDRVGTRLTGGGDDDMIRRVIALGGVMLYEPGAVVGHRVPPARMRRRWFWNRCFWGGASEPRLWPDERVTAYQLLRATWHVELMSWRAFRAGLWHGPRSADCFRQALNVASRCGIWMGLLGELWRGRARPRYAPDHVAPTVLTSNSPDRLPSSQTRESPESQEVVLGGVWNSPSQSLPEFAMLLNRILLPVALLGVVACTQPVEPPGDSPSTGSAPEQPNRLEWLGTTKMPTFDKPVSFDTPEADAILDALKVFPADNPWNIVVQDWPPHPDSASMIASIGGDKPLRYNPDMAFVLVPSNQPKVAVKLTEFPDESDAGPYPLPDNVPIEGWPAHYTRYVAPRDARFKGLTLADLQRNKFDEDADRHALVVDPVNHKLYEFSRLVRTERGWHAACAATFDLKSNKLRPDGWTSADAAGLPIFPAVVRYDELRRGKVEHALRVTVRKTRRAYVYPATHFASKLNDEKLPRMGERIRLKKDFNTAPFSPEVKVILEALKKYGMLVADNGIEWGVSVAPDERIPLMHTELRRVKGSDFEVITPPPDYTPAK